MDIFDSEWWGENKVVGVLDFGLTQTPYFLHMSDYFAQNGESETIYFINPVIIFTYLSIEYCC